MTRDKVIVAMGKRKRAIAKATIKKGKGTVRINKTPIEIWEPALAREKMMEPLSIAGERTQKVDISVNVRGGGYMGQADAARTAMARGLSDYFGEELLGLYAQKDRSLIVSDTRRREAKHPLGRGARKKRQKSYR